MNVVVVVGAGATGLGVAWDLILRGVPVTVVESQDIGSGTSGRFHGLLHSGGRYVMTDPESAQQCREENAILRKIVPSAIEGTGGYFVAVDEAGVAVREDWEQGARRAGIPYEVVDRDKLRQAVGGLSPQLSFGFWVPDGVLKGFELLQLLYEEMMRRGARVLTHTRLEAVEEQNGVVTGAVVRGPQGSETIACDALINASGPSADAVARLLGDSIPMQLGAGLMLIFANRNVPVVVNRLGMPGDGDILVPHGRTVILGTTDVVQSEADPPLPRREEARYLLSMGQAMFPQMDQWRTLRAFTGVRPLYHEAQDNTESRRVSRDFVVLNHGQRGGLSGTFSIVGGKWTTFRLMAERTVDQVLAYLHQESPCRTSTTPIAPANQAPSRHTSEPTLCECEAVTASDLEKWPDLSLNEVRSRTWFAMGPCQGTVCGHRAALLKVPREGTQEAQRQLQELREEREKGQWPVAWGDTAKEMAFNRAVRLQTLFEEDVHATD